MKLEAILNGSSICIDTNVLIYARRNRSQQCRGLLVRCESKAVIGVITSLVLAEFCHRRMMQESQALGLTMSNPAKSLGQRPDMVRQLSGYADDVRALAAGDLTIVPIEATDFAVALELQRQHGLLTNDSLNLAVAKRLGIKEIVTADTHFDAVQGIIIYKPDDLIL